MSARLAFTGARFLMAWAGLAFGVVGLVCSFREAWHLGFEMQSLAVVCWASVSWLYARERLASRSEVRR